jgi:ribosomal protein S18 acetylase RimI-like enzyme
MDIKIRKATIDDIEAISELNLLIADHHADIDSFYARGEEVNKTFPSFLGEDLAKETSINLVAETDGKIVGWFSGSIKREAPHLSEKTLGHIGSAFILPEYRRKGIAKLMFQEIVNWFKEKGAKMVDLSVDGRNLEGLRVWEGLGFKEYAKKMKMEI